MLPIIKQNINKIDFNLKKLFENVYVTEKCDKNNFFLEISANKLVNFENCNKRVNVKIEINKNDILSENIKWSYFINPLNESIGKIERISNINNIADDINDIVENKRMINEYFNALEPIVELILEDNKVVDTLSSNISKVVEKYAKIDNINDCGDYSLITTNENIKLSDKFNIEKDLLKNENIEFISFDDNIIKVTFKK
jgi:hypothetical protein